MRALFGRGPFAGLPAPFWKLFAATLVNRLGSFVVPFLALYLGSQRGVAPTTAGIIVGFFGGGAIVAGPLGGTLADRLGRRRTIVFGMSLSALAMLGLAVAVQPVELAIACFFLGIATESPRPAMNALVADIVPAADRTRAYAALYWAANLGFSCAALLAGFASSVSFGVLFVVDAITCLACAAIVQLSVPANVETKAEETTRFSMHDVTRPFRDPRFTRFFLATLTVALVFFQFQVAMPLDMKAHGISTPAYGALVALNGVLVITLQPFATSTLLRLPRHAALALSAVLTGIGFGALGFASTIPGYAIAITIFTLGEVAMAPVNPAVVSELAPPSLRGTYQGAFMLAFSIAACLAPLAGGFVLDRLGSSALWAGCFALGLVSAALHSSSHRPPAPDLSEEATPSSCT